MFFNILKYVSTIICKVFTTKMLRKVFIFSFENSTILCEIVLNYFRQPDDLKHIFRQQHCIGEPRRLSEDIMNIKISSLRRRRRRILSKLSLLFFNFEDLYLRSKKTLIFYIFYYFFIIIY